jgi:hypothetical protein
MPRHFERQVCRSNVRLTQMSEYGYIPVGRNGCAIDRMAVVEIASMCGVQGAMVTGHAREAAPTM